MTNSPPTYLRLAISRLLLVGLITCSLLWSAECLRGNASEKSPPQYMLSDLSKGRVKKSLPTPWEDFPKGSWVVLETTDQKGERVKNYKLKYEQIQSPLERSQLARHVPALCQLDLYGPNEPTKEFSDKPEGGPLWFRFGISPSSLLSDPRVSVVKRTTGSLYVDSKAYKCKKTHYVISFRNGARVSYVLWRHQGLKLPVRRMPMRSIMHASIVGPNNCPQLLMGPDIMRAEVSSTAPEIKVYAVSTVVSLSGTRRIGKEELECVIQQGWITQQFEDKQSPTQHTSIVQWFSGDVPGHVVDHQAMNWRSGKLHSKLRERAVEYHVPSQP